MTDVVFPTLWVALVAFSLALLTVLLLGILIGRGKLSAAVHIVGGTIPIVVVALLWWARVTDYRWVIEGPGLFAHVGGGPAAVAALTASAVWAATLWFFAWRGLSKEVPPFWKREPLEEGLLERVTRFGFNLIPAYRGTGGRVEAIAPGWRTVRVRLPLSWRTRNYVGTIFGGSLYGAIDPVYMLMLIKVLGPEYIVWDKAATIRFRKPGRSTLYATFELTDEDLEEVRRRVAAEGKIEWRRLVTLTDAEGIVHAECEKVLSIRKK